MKFFLPIIYLWAWVNALNLEFAKPSPTTTLPTLVWVTGTDESGITRTTQSIFTQQFRELKTKVMIMPKAGNLHLVSSNYKTDDDGSSTMNFQNKYSQLKDEESKGLKRNGTSWNLVFILLIFTTAFMVINVL
ncbi:uncharacterized protein ASCRUDRAFT_70873 [Ascoidea rubescens DSM 1968]|uniref:DUF3533 domain-containing protein n=1 Tax=Ascoidea rubescens DSM 1968 TaxID=1344418 RepID=A0A1D2VFQ4_9ASCO|nr:hypothetical protein ASCRUDRAFT_70873 [Ascoidea rubescens DSM 1968]ODV60350.1 hypothetical protein ASCRUDRAFT_70873 [Ascoidea rubescens DSM 1968]